MFEKEPNFKATKLETLPAPLRLELQKLTQGARSLESFLEVLASAPLILEAFLIFGNTLDRCQLSSELQTKIYLAIGELSCSPYDVSAATVRARELGMSEEEIKRARCGLSDFPQHSAVLQFAQKLVQKHGHLKPDEIERLRQHIHDESTIVEIVAAVAHVHFSALLNNLADTPLDHPPVEEIRNAS